MKIKISNLTLTQLDWVVAKCEGLDIQSPGELTDDEYYSTNWAQGGPIIEHKLIHITREYGKWKATMYLDNGIESQRGDTPLIAAMRCYVAGKLGEEIEIPDEL